MFTVFSNILGSTQLEVRLHTYLWSSTWTLLFIFLSYYHNYIHTCGAEIMHWVGNVDVFFLAVENVSIWKFCMQVLALVGDQLDYGDNICGAVLSIRFNEDILSVWNRNAKDHEVSSFFQALVVSAWPSLADFGLFYQAVMALRDAIKRHLKLPPSYVMEYKPHDASLRDNSSYRNTWLRG